MIKKGTVGHEVLMTVINNPMTIEALSHELDVEMANIRASVRYMTTKQGVNLQRKGSSIWIDRSCEIETDSMRHDALYVMLMVYKDGLTVDEISAAFGCDSSSANIKQVIKSLEVKYEVKVVRRKTGGAYKYLLSVNANNEPLIDMNTKVKLAIINNPGVSAREVARISGSTVDYVYFCYEELNIPRRRKPPHYVG